MKDNGSLSYRIQGDYITFVELLNVDGIKENYNDELSMFHKLVYCYKELILLNNTNKIGMTYFIESISDLLEFVNLVCTGKIKPAKMLLRSFMETNAKAIYYSILCATPNDGYSNNLDIIIKQIKITKIEHKSKIESKKITKELEEKLKMPLKENYYWPICDYVHSNNETNLTGSEYLIEIFSVTKDFDKITESLDQAIGLIKEIILLTLLSKLDYYLNEAKSEKVTYVISLLNDSQRDLLVL